MVAGAAGAVAGAAAFGEIVGHGILPGAIFERQTGHHGNRLAGDPDAFQPRPDCAALADLMRLQDVEFGKACIAHDMVRAPAAIAAS